MRSQTKFTTRSQAAFLIALCLLARAVAQSRSETTAAPDGMALIKGDEFQMGGVGPEARENELPVHTVRVDAFWIDVTEVTNAQFRAFVDATGYLTTAEKAPSLEEIMKQLPPGTPPPAPEILKPGSLVFVPPSDRVPLDDVSGWWQWIVGADWKHPKGPGSDLDGLENHPVVQISWDDAVAYANWAKKRLPTEAEWECAARAGIAGKRYCWGDDGLDAKKPQANVWEGSFPTKNTGEDGFTGTAPVKSFPPNAAGLYDMAGNVWEWCADWYRADAYRLTQSETRLVNPHGPESSLDPDEPYAPKRTIRGGSFMCHASYCLSYRPSARRGETPDTGTSNVGFRCVISADAWAKREPEAK